MQINILKALYDDKMMPYLKENSEWFKYLNRNPKLIKLIMLLKILI